MNIEGQRPSEEIRDYLATLGDLRGRELFKEMNQQCCFFLFPK